MSRTLLFGIVLICSLTVVHGCHNREHNEHDEKWGTDSFFMDSTDTVPEKFKDGAPAQHGLDSVLPGYRQQPAHGKSRKSDRNYSQDDDDDETYDAEEAEKERRMRKLNRDFDAGIYGEHTKGFDRDNYDPDIDDW